MEDFPSLASVHHDSRELNLFLKGEEKHECFMRAKKVLFHLVKNGVLCEISYYFVNN